MRPDQPVLSGLSLDIPDSSTCALVGRSGGGKSTLCHLTLRFYDPSAGRVCVDGRNLRELNLEWVHRHMGVVAQARSVPGCYPDATQGATQGYPLRCGGGR